MKIRMDVIQSRGAQLLVLNNTIIELLDIRILDVYDLALSKASSYVPVITVFVIRPCGGL